MHAAHGPELRAALALPRRSAEITLLRQRVDFEQRVEPDTVLRAVEAAVEAHHPQTGEPRLRGLHHRNRVIGVAALPHHLVVQDEAVLVLQDADRHAQLHRTPRLALRDPAGVRLEDREHLLRARDRLAPEKAAVCLVCLAPRVRGTVFDPNGFPCPHPMRRQLRLRRLRSGGKIKAALKVLLDMLRPGAARHPHPVEQPPHLPRQVFPLPPARRVSAG